MQENRAETIWLQQVLGLLFKISEKATQKKPYKVQPKNSGQSMVNLKLQPREPPAKHKKKWILPIKFKLVL